MSTEESWIGATIGERYIIDKRVARGGMSTVYLAHDERLHRDVAIKVLFPHMAEDRKVVQRFEQEARNSALISHPNVVQVLDQGQTRETAYMVMEYVPGATLRTLLKRGPMTPRLALAYAQAILGGLSAAHQAGLVHRDIKPENVLVSPEGRIKLADFGLARAATHHSGTSTLMGTVAYIAPELLSGEGADERADIYAVGILLYELLTGVQPFTGDSPVRVAFQHVNSTVPAPSSYVPGLAGPLDDLVREATHAETAQRPKNADAMLELLESSREQLTAAELDFDGAIAKHQRHHGVEPEDEDLSQGSSTHVLPSKGGTPSLESEQDPSADEWDEDELEPDHSADEASTVAMGAEDFPTAVEHRHDWDDDVTTALGHSSGGSAPRPQAHEEPPSGESPPSESWSSLAVEDRQTVAEVPLQLGRLSVEEHQTGRQSPTPQPQRRSYDPRADKRQRQRPLEQLNGPSHVRQAVAFVIVLMLTAVLMLIGYQLGITNRFIPSLGG